MWTRLSRLWSPGHKADEESDTSAEARDVNSDSYSYESRNAEALQLENTTSTCITTQVKSTSTPTMTFHEPILFGHYDVATAMDMTFDASAAQADPRKSTCSTDTSRQLSPAFDRVIQADERELPRGSNPVFATLAPNVGPEMSFNSGLNDTFCLHPEGIQTTAATRTGTTSDILCSPLQVATSYDERPLAQAHYVLGSSYERQNDGVTRQSGHYYRLDPDIDINLDTIAYSTAMLGNVAPRVAVERPANQPVGSHTYDNVCRPDVVWQSGGVLKTPIIKSKSSDTDRHRHDDRARTVR